MIRVRLLGTLELESSDGRPLRAVLAQPKRFALLAYLAARPRAVHRRDSLFALFWPDADTTHARWALSQALRFLRKELGGSALVSRNADEIAVDPTAIWCDAAAFRDHVDQSRFGEALELYRGDFLDGFFAEAGAEFDEWLSRERAQLRASAATAARALAELRENEQNFTTAVAAARRAADLAVSDERVFRELLELLDRLGDRAGAIRAYDEFAKRLVQDFEAEPAAETKALIDRIRSRETTAGTVERPSRNGWPIVRELGRGGMATVYLARDVKHSRHVALKVMRPELAITIGAERFLREIQITANLAHPHILPLIDSGADSGVPYLVTPYVAGESLRARLQREHQMPAPEALRIATEVAEALDYAHRSGIVHRDIKPENILLADGHAVVADFGVARAVLASGGAVDDGTVAGSPAYMSPEAASGTDVNARTDIYSLGCVLFEMLMGEVPNGSEPSASLSAAGVAPPIATLVAECLARDPENRPRSAAEVLARLGTENTNGATPRRAGASRRMAELRRASRMVAAAVTRRSPWLVGGAAIGVVVATFIMMGARAAPSDGTTVRFVFTPDTGITFANDVRGALAISPDGRMTAYVGRDSMGHRRIHLRTVGELQSRTLSGSDSAEQLFFSTDGKWLGFYVAPLLKKVSVVSGEPVLIGEAPGMLGASWLPSGEIILSTARHLATIPGAGGSLRQMSFPDTAKGERQQIWPVMLPDGKSFVYTVRGRFLEESRIGIGTVGDAHPTILDLPGTGAVGLIEGQLVFLDVLGRRGRHGLLAVPFDLRRRRAVGEPYMVAQGVNSNAWGAGAAALSASGTLVTLHTEPIQRQIQIVRPKSTATVLPGDAAAYFDPRFSPDGKRLAVRVNAEELKVFDLESGTLTRLVGERASYPEWTPDGKRLVFLRRCGVGRTLKPGVGDDGSPCGFVSLPVDQSAPPQHYLIDSSPVAEVATLSLSPDGRTLVARVNLRATYERDIWYRGPTDTALKPLVTLPGNQFGPRISPDGKWVAFWTDTRPSRVFVTPLVAGGPVYQVSADAGEMPVWSGDGKRLYYVNGTNGTRILAATLRLSPTFAVTQRDTVFDGGFDARTEFVAAYDVASDGRFALMLRRDPLPQLVVARDWQFELRERHHAP